jgi:hypothetical protein
MFVIPSMTNQAVAMASPPPHLLLCILIAITSYSRENGRELTVLGLGGELSVSPYNYTLTRWKSRPMGLNVGREPAATLWNMLEFWATIY